MEIKTKPSKYFQGAFKNDWQEIVKFVAQAKDLNKAAALYMENARIFSNDNYRPFYDLHEITAIEFRNCVSEFKDNQPTYLILS